MSAALPVVTTTNEKPIVRPLLSRERKSGRASCIECVEKHIGSAIVLIAETLVSYPEHRLLVIGHLAEAEAESVAWPILRNAIRSARIKYQRSGRAPLLKSLWELIEGARDSQEESASLPRPDNDCGCGKNKKKKPVLSSPPETNDEQN